MRGAAPERELDKQVAAALDAAGVDGRVVVACSGGPDSVALAAILARLAAREGEGAEIVLGHVNHGTRESAWQDECVVLALGARFGVPVRIVALASGRDDEASLRAARYDALVAIARECDARAIVTAHTAEDQTETVLLALFRGTGIDGLAGMPLRREIAPGIALVRPLLALERADLHADLRANALPYAIDPTNEGGRYKRSAIRDALAMLRAEFPHLDAAVARCAALARDERERPDLAAARRALREQLRAEGVLADVPFERIEAAIRAEQAGPGRRVQLGDGVELVTGGRDAPSRIERRD